MKKCFSLLKACLTDNMNLFKINNKNQNNVSKKALPIFVVVIFFFSVWSYANMIIEPLIQFNMEILLLTLFILITSFLTLTEGIYKSSSILFNCKDDNLLLSLPIKKSTVLFIRIFKFYLFELLYNSLFLIPAIVVYIRYVNVNASFYIISIISLLIFPIIPIIISCIIGVIVSFFSSKFKLKNIVQIFLTTIFLLIVFYIVFNLQNLVENLAQNATTINEIITKLYYPAGAYIKLITEFNILDLIIFIGSHLILFMLTIFTLSKIYFKINSKVKIVKTEKKKSNYKIITKKPLKALVKKELNRFISTPVFVINAAFGLVLFLVSCILLYVKFDSLSDVLAEQGINITMEQIQMYIPIILFGLICFASLMSSITSSMISLEGKSFNILKSLPIKPFTIITSKIITAVLIMLPFLLIGDFIVFLKFRFNIIDAVIILVSSIIIPLVVETIGIIVNLKYPKMDAENDTEVVKQSTSSLIAVLTGMILTGITIFALYKAISIGLSTILTISFGLLIYLVIYAILFIYLKKNCTKMFNMINVY